MSESVKPFSSNADLEAASQIAKRFAAAGAVVKPIGKEVLAALDQGGLPESAYDRLARMCRNKNVDHKRNVAMARELSELLFGCVIESSS
jgi:hypothetical protein